MIHCTMTHGEAIDSQLVNKNHKSAKFADAKHHKDQGLALCPSGSLRRNNAFNFL
jgi:hypothetical protein